MEKGVAEIWDPLPALQPPIHPLSPRLMSYRRAPDSPVKGLLRRAPLSGEAAQYEEMVALPLKCFAAATSASPRERYIGVTSARQMTEIISLQPNVVETHRNIMSLVLPTEAGIYCKDLDPTEYWAAGVQICSVPHLLQGFGKLISHVRFAENGRVGYVLKPPQLVGQDSRHQPVDLQLKVSVIFLTFIRFLFSLSMVAKCQRGEGLIPYLPI